MTTIAYKDGYLAADSFVAFQAMRFGEINKIHETKDYWLAGAGTLAVILEFKKYLEGEEYSKEILSNKEEQTDFILISKKNKKVYICSSCFPTLQSIKAEYYSIGSGCHFAYGAMAAGKSAKEAVKIAAKFDRDTNDKVKVKKIV